MVVAYVLVIIVLEQIISFFLILYEYILEIVYELGTGIGSFAFKHCLSNSNTNKVFGLSSDSQNIWKQI